MADPAKIQMTPFRKAWLAYWIGINVMVVAIVLLTLTVNSSSIMFGPLILWMLFGWIPELLAAFILSVRRELRWTDAWVLMPAIAGRYFCFWPWFMIAETM